jgi:hypothetical protein
MIGLYEQWKQHLEPKGVLFNFSQKSQNYKCLEVLYSRLGQWVTKSDLIALIDYKGNDLQAPRHLWNGSGWFVESNNKGGGNLAYRLVSVEEPSPGWIPVKRTQGLNVADWDALKAEYDYCCASCGAKENEPHRYHERNVTLEKGHMDPRKDMSTGNIIPQCNFCNKHYSNKAVFDRYGRVTKWLK